ncbi:adenylyl-sulfate kinase [Deltaproteobacteria bacterium PRO3]|nr:adenylyl-sulfate kinase [Deltaproteobacteria bacterium PRO3]
MTQAQPKSQNIVWHHGKLTPQAREEHLGQKGAVVWLTGLSASGKSTVAREVELALIENGINAYVLDGDVECRGDGAVLGIALVDGVHCPNLPVPANGLQPLAFAGDARHFFWSDTHCGERRASPTGIFRVDRATGISTLVVPNEVASELEVGKRGLYWRGRFGVRKALASEPGSVPVLAHTAHSLVVAGGTIYYAADDGIHWVSEEGGLDRLIPDGCGSIMTALDGSNVDHLTSLSRGRSRGSGLGTSPSA